MKQWPNKVEPFTKGLALSSLWLLLLIKITRIKLVLILTMIFSKDDADMMMMMMIIMMMMMMISPIIATRKDHHHAYHHKERAMY